MPRSPCSFRETDVRRAVRAARSSGLEIGRIEIAQDGRIIVVAGKPKEAANQNKEGNEWDDAR